MAYDHNFGDRKENKVALITGASRGIGAAIARRFAQDGYHLVLCCAHSAEKMEQLADVLRREWSVEILTRVGDVGSFVFVSKLCADALEWFGKVDVLINNAGIAHIGLLQDMDEQDWNRMLSVDLSAAFAACKALIPSMVARQSGRIINISSVWGEAGASCEAAYSAAKGGLNAFTKALGKELAPSHIPVNAIACGLIDTEMNAQLSQEELDALLEAIPAGRMGQPEEVAELAAMLAAAPEYLTGQVITLDGGWM